MTSVKGMIADGRRNIAGYILVVYFVAVGSFQLGRFGSIPFRGLNRQSELNPFTSALNLVQSAHTCPAQIYAQTAISPGIVTVDVFVPTRHTIFSVGGSGAECFKRVFVSTGRAPPSSSLCQHSN